MSQLPRLALVAATLAACGSPGSFKGAVDGKKFAVKSSAFAVVTPPVVPDSADPAGTAGTDGTAATTPTTGTDGAAGTAGTPGTASLSGPVAVVILSDSDDICADAKSGKLAANRSYFILSLAKLDLASQTFAAPAPGTYLGVDVQGGTDGIAAAAAAGGFAGGYLLAGNGSCTNTLGADAATVVGGTVTVSELNAKSGGAARGDYSVSVGSQHSAVSGSFDAPFCGALAGFAQSVIGASATPCH